MYRVAIGSSALALAVAASFLPACGGSDSGTSGNDCDRATIEQAVAAQGTSDAPARLDDYGCADGWAYAFADVGSGEEQVTVTFVLRTSDGSWSVEDRASVCKAPGDEVPESIYRDACETN